MVFVYDFHPGSETLMLRHFAHSAHHMNGYNNPFSMDGGARPFSAKGGRGSKIVLHITEIFSVINFASDYKVQVCSPPSKCF